MREYSYTSDGFRIVKSSGMCPYFDRTDTSLIEEPEECLVCRYYDDVKGICLKEENKAK